MNDAYAEWLVKRKNPTYTVVLTPVVILLCIIGVMATLYIQIFGFIIAAAIFFGAYMFFRNLKVEYEYIFVSGQISFDKILSQSKRKRLINCEMENVLVVAPVDSYLIKDQVNANTKLKDFSSQMPDRKFYALIYQTGSDRHKIIFEPNEKILECLKQSSPRKVTL